MDIYLKLIVGLIILVFGGEFLVRGSVSIARQFHVSPLIIGLTVVAFGTSAPEFVVSLKAVISGASGIAVGTIVGSNIANVLLVLGLPAFIFATRDKTGPVLNDVIFMVIASVLMLLFAANGMVERWQGVILFILLLAYLVVRYRKARMEMRGQVGAYQAYENPLLDKISARFLRQKSAERTEGDEKVYGTPESVIRISIGIAALWWGSLILVPAAVAIATTLGVSEKVIGVAMVGVGTSFPELTTSIVATIRRHGDIAIGNIVGSNLFNILGVLGITAMVVPVPVGQGTLHFDIWVMIIAALLLIPIAIWSRTVGRIGGLFFMALYGAYVAANFLIEDFANWPLW